MNDTSKTDCPDCTAIDRRNFIRVLGTSTAALATVAGAGVPLARLGAADVKKDKTPKPSEELVRELHASLSDDQKSKVVMPWDHGSNNGKATPTRLRMFNSPIEKKTIKDHYSKAQQELCERILKSISSGDDGFRQLCRGGDFDGSGAFENCGALIFGDPADKKQFAWVFTGHHLTVRCDGNSEPGAAFGGPMYYGHSPNGYSEKNIFNYQTKSVLSVLDALDEDQRKKAIVDGTPGEGEGSIKFKGKDQQKPGIVFADLSKDQKALVEKVMRTVVSPYRKEDADEVMEIVKANGGLEKIHLAFYKDGKVDDKQPWHFWRLEGPGFVWNYRVLPHVHTYVYISSKV